MEAWIKNAVKNVLRTQPRKDQRFFRVAGGWLHVTDAMRLLEVYVSAAVPDGIYNEDFLPLNPAPKYPGVEVILGEVKPDTISMDMSPITAKVATAYIAVHLKTGCIELWRYDKNNPTDGRMILDVHFAALLAALPGYSGTMRFSAWNHPARFESQTMVVQNGAERPAWTYIVMPCSR